ncbi:hypothetical protein ARMGADRAFT_589370 [Armillaria gallica]|uniref:Uncharacterized protein n=1 Tax=Armillaria gallica TaxID=47427 RepID=A0A2H3EHL6_ARMGA|nr:hypothetical protein ARMGADRAFT_589370 [Armillaria gallica]
MAVEDGGMRQAVREVPEGSFGPTVPEILKPAQRPTTPTVTLILLGEVQLRSEVQLSPMSTSYRPQL